MKKMKHEMITVAEFIKQGMKNQVLHFVDRRLPKFQSEDSQGRPIKGSMLGGHLVDEFFVVDNITFPQNLGYGPNVYSIAGIPMRPVANRLSIYLHSTMQLKVLTGATAKKIREEFDAERLKTLWQQLGHSFSIGSDPEIFVEDAAGQVIPAFHFLKGKKDKDRHKTYDGSGLYWDGFQAEFETVSATCLDGHRSSVYNGIIAVESAAKKFNSKAKLSLKTVMEIPETMLQDSKEEHVSLGCMPSLNVYGSKGIEVEPRQLKIRSAGGHIHFGIGKRTKEEIDRGVKALDMILGVACVSLFQKYDRPERRRHYGLAGEYRLPAHGLEYRTLSNAWLTHPFIMNIVFDTARKALMFGLKNFNNHWNATEKETVECINNCDVELAHKIMERNKDMLKIIFKAAYQQATDVQLEALYQIFFNGMDSAIENPEEIGNNWRNTAYAQFRGGIRIVEVGKKIA